MSAPSSIAGTRRSTWRTAMSKHDYPRDLVGYGAEPPDPHWPGGARIAVADMLRGRMNATTR